MWNPSTKPPPGICPEQFCFHWLEKGSRFAAGLHKNLEDALHHTVQQDVARCGCSFGICTRMSPAEGDHDWYEPHEPRLERAGLPWFYFIPRADKLVDELKSAYRSESEQLWGMANNENA